MLTAIDKENRVILGATSTGFVRSEPDGNYLYTCWHVVSEFNPHDLKVKNPPVRRYLSVSMQASTAAENIETIGGLRSFTIPLYDESQVPARPLWLQDNAHIPHPDLNAIGIYVPFWHDVVKIRIPEVFTISNIQLITKENLLTDPLGNEIGEKCLIVGFPYGYSALGPKQPTPIALTRFVAAKQIAGRRRELLLESPGAPGMSGAPVFKEHGGNLLLFGVYTGLIYPDHVVASTEKTTALGTIVDITLLFNGAMQLTQTPSDALTNEGFPYRA